MFLGSRGLRDMDDGIEAIDEAAERAAVRRQTVQVLVRAAGVALVLTAGALLLPA